MSDMIDSVISALQHSRVPLLPKFPYTGTSSKGIGLAAYSMAKHTSNEGWEIFRGLGENGYILYGNGLPNGSTDVLMILRDSTPGVVVIQDKREWELSSPRDFRNPADRFTNYYSLGLDTDIFKVSILKDAHQRPEYHYRFFEEIQAHGIITYYHPRIVTHLASYVRPGSIIRTYHTLDPATIPSFNGRGDRQGALLSGAMSNAYPLRTALHRSIRSLPLTNYLPHPGYHRNGCNTPQYLQTLNRYRVAICTCSIYGYALRKIIEATAAGCIVLTNLPSDEVLPGIDENLVRISSRISVREVGDQIRLLYTGYNEERQRHFAQIARDTYDYRVVTRKLADDIETLRQCSR